RDLCADARRGDQRPHLSGLRSLLAPAVLQALCGARRAGAGRLMLATRLNLLDLREGKTRTLHFAWLAFFLTFVVWFNHAPLLVQIRDSLGLSDAQVKALLTL